ncbi:4Fe-4S binding protein [Lachnospiraceae bacterium 46-15]
MNYLRYLEKEIHSVIMATVDDNGLPVTCAIDIMDSDENGLYFLTAKGKGFYYRLKKSGYAALTGMKGSDTLSCVAVSVRSKVQEIGNAPLKRLFEKNPYMNEIYPTEQSRQALTVFQLYEGSGEWFDLSKKPIERAAFTIGNKQEETQGYEITQECIRCKACQIVCPQNCIDFTVIPAVIKQENCLHCGNCFAVCPQKAVVRRG